MDEETLLARANEERERLFQRYERGREPGAEIDPWEDPGFEVYHQTDRYGFIHDKRLPQKIDPNEAKARTIELERVKKWLKMLNRWNSKETHEKLRRRIYKGIPDKLRSQVWMKLLNIEQIMAEKKDVYQNMLKLAKQWSTEARQIDSDVNRQFREHLFYRERYSIKQRSLFNVLTAYSMYNMEVGYCQGMSGVAGVLLMYMDEEEAFWALSTLLADKKFAMHGLYIEGFPKLNRLVQHHDKILEKFLPKLKNHFDMYNLDSMIYSLKWFFVIFIERIPFNLCLRVWDIYLLDGEKVVTAMAYTILKLHQKKLIKLKDMDLLVQYLQTKLHKDFGYDDDTVIKTLEQALEELRKAKMDLASPDAPDAEFPKRPFGVFIEPPIESKIGRRKLSFTKTEKEVTETVILRREKTQQELVDSTISDGGLDESNSQLNTGNIPESEDGGSLLGSSRKSLADTSITSTADLSVFSTGQRSQQFDICIDDTRSIHSEAEDEEDGSSPRSAFGSLSIVGRTPSAMMITPTPRAISPHDIVRIYVPPAPLEEQGNAATVTTTSVGQQENIGNSPQPSLPPPALASSSSNRRLPEKSNNKRPSISNDNISDDPLDGISSSNYNTDNGSNRNSIISGETTPIRRSFIYKSNEDLTLNGQKSSSSSRRGSLTRKSPSKFLESSNFDCEHLKMKRGSINSSDEQVYKNIKAQSTQATAMMPTTTTTTAIENDGGTLNRTKCMTSFEELARIRKEQNNQKYYKQNPMMMTQSSYSENAATFTSDDDDYSPKCKYDSDCNIQYRALATSPSSIDIDFVQSDITQIIRKTSDNSDEYSSSSPNVISVLTTPVNEQIPSTSALATSQSTQKLINSGETTPTSTITNSSESKSTNCFNIITTATVKGGSSNDGGYKDGKQNEINRGNIILSTSPTSSSSYSSNIQTFAKYPQHHNYQQPQYHYNMSNEMNYGEQQYVDISNTSFTFIQNPKDGSNLITSTSTTSSNDSHSNVSDKLISNEFDKRIAAPLGGPYDYKSHSNARETNKIRIKVQQNQ